MLKICRRSAKDPATLRAKLWRAAGGVAPQSQSALAMLLRRALSVARQKSLAHSFPIYEIGFSQPRIPGFCRASLINIPALAVC